MGHELLFLNSAFEGPGPTFDAVIKDGRLRVIEEERLPSLDPVSVGGLIITSHVDQRWLAERKTWLETCLDGGARVVFNGHVESDFIDGLERYQPLKDRSVAAFAVTREADHPIWADYAGDELTFRKGVAGFYGRGCNPAPAGATVINRLDAGKERLPVDWEWRRPRGGRVLSHAGNDLWVTFEQTELNAELVGRIVDWMEQRS